MSKRSREASFSPSADLASPSVSVSGSGDEAGHPLKISALSEDQEDLQPAMQCTLPPHRHPVDFLSIDAFEVHYAKEHSNRCSSCRKNFPSTHFLTLHLDEHHNALREELEAKGEKTYGCFVEDCEKKCSSPQKRRLHLIDKHLFPKIYNFRVVATGIDKRTSMLREPTHRRRVSTATSPADTVTRHRRRSSHPIPNGLDSSTSDRPKDCALPSKETGQSRLAEHAGTTLASDSQSNSMSELESSMSALRFVPPSVARQHGKTKGA